MPATVQRSVLNVFKDTRNLKILTLEIKGNLKPRAIKSLKHVQRYIYYIYIYALR